MPNLLVKTDIAAGEASAWVATDGQSGIVVGFGGAGAKVEFHLGDENHTYTSGAGKNMCHVLVAKAAAVRVVAGNGPAYIEVFA